MFEDEKDDAISQLFKRSEHNLDRDLPSGDLWSRIENRLDQSTPLKVTKAPVQRPRYLLAAAAVLACALSVGAIWQFFEHRPSEQVLAELRSDAATTTATDKMEEAEDISTTLPTNEIEKEVLYKKEDSAQAAKLPQSVAEKETAKMPRPIELKTEKVVEPTTTVAITQATPNAVSPVMAADSAAYIYASKTATTNDNAGISPSNDMVVNATVTVQNSNRYAAPPIAKADEERIAQAEKIQLSENYALEMEDQGLSSNSVRSKKDVARKESKSRDKASAKAASPSAPKAADDFRPQTGPMFDKLHPRLFMFSWLIGQWNEDRYDGNSLEEWSIKNKNTISGKGYKFKNSDKLFEESMTIFFDENLQQIYLSLQVDDLTRPIVYALRSVESDQIVFIRDTQGDFPEKVILQRNKDGYSMIFANEKAELNTTQQSYLNHRNAVSNYKASRHLRRNTAINRGK